MTAIYTASGVELPADTDWTDADENLPANELRKLPIFRLALALRAYAYYGLWLKVSEPDDDCGLTEFLEQIDPDNPYQFLPREWFLVKGSEKEEMTRTINAALARRKLDYPDESKDLSPDELAALARVSQKTIMNLIAPSSGTGLRLNAKGKIPLEDARRWLLARPDFRPSVGQQQQGQTSRPKAEGALPGDPVFVPVAEDGTWFSPAESRIPVRSSQARGKEPQPNKKTYRVGDESFDDYWQALEALHRLEPPRWRHPDTGGRARAKVGTGWMRKTRQELEHLLVSIQKDQANPKNGRRRS